MTLYPSSPSSLLSGRFASLRDLVERLYISLVLDDAGLVAADLADEARNRRLGADRVDIGLAIAGLAHRGRLTILVLILPLLVLITTGTAFINARAALVGPVTLPLLSTIEISSILW